MQYVQQGEQGPGVGEVMCEKGTSGDDVEGQSTLKERGRNNIDGNGLNKKDLPTGEKVKMQGQERRLVREGELDGGGLCNASVQKDGESCSESKGTENHENVQRMYPVEILGHLKKCVDTSHNEGGQLGLQRGKMGEAEDADNCGVGTQKECAEGNGVSSLTTKPGEGDVDRKKVNTGREGDDMETSGGCMRGGIDPETKEKSLKGLEDALCVGSQGSGPGPKLGKKRGRPLKSSGLKATVRNLPVTPKLEEPRAVRCNRGIKRRFPGDESDDSGVPKRIRVKSIASVCMASSQSPKGKDLVEEDMKRVPPRARGRPRKCGPLLQQPPNNQEGQRENRNIQSHGKRKMVEAVMDSESLKRSRYSRNGQSFACNVEGCKKRFMEATALYIHARVHGDRPYVCHYENCIKRFSERSKLKRHFLIHTGEKPFLCLYEGCGKAFSLDFNLRSHMKTHTGDYHECPHDGCQKRYCQEYKLRAHICKEHSKQVKGLRKSNASMGDEVRVANKCLTHDIIVSKKRERLVEFELRRSKLERWKEGTKNRIAELDRERGREVTELARIEQALQKLEREQLQLVEGHGGSPAESLSLSEEEEEDDEEEDEDEDDDMVPANEVEVDTSSSGEQQRGFLKPHLEDLAMLEGRDVLVFAHKFPTADQGARLVKSIEPRIDSNTELSNGFSPLLWLPSLGFPSEQPALRPFLRPRRPLPMSHSPAQPDLNSNDSKLIRAVQELPEADPLLRIKENSASQNGLIGEVWLESRNMEDELGKSQRECREADGDVEKPKGDTDEDDEEDRKLKGKSDGGLVALDEDIGQCDGHIANSCEDLRSNGEIKKIDEDAKHESEQSSLSTTSLHKKREGLQFAFSDQVFLPMNHISQSTDQVFLAAKEGPNSSSRDPMFAPREKIFASVHDDLCPTNPGFSVIDEEFSAVNDGFSAEQASEQSLHLMLSQQSEPPVSQLFTCQEQPQLVD